MEWNWTGNEIEELADFFGGYQFLQQKLWILFHLNSCHLVQFLYEGDFYFTLLMMTDSLWRAPWTKQIDLPDRSTLQIQIITEVTRIRTVVYSTFEIVGF